MRKTGLMLRCWLLTLTLGALCAPAKGLDLISLQGPDPAKGKIPDFKNTVLEEALKRTEKKFGPYRFVSFSGSLSRDRVFEELSHGRMINVAMVATQQRWEEKLIPVRIPVDMGLSGLRIALIRSDAQPLMASVRSMASLKALRMGVGASWSSRKVAEANGFNVVPAENYEALLKMLMAERSDYFPRSLNEAFSEYEAHNAEHSLLTIDTSVLLNMPLPTYIFVSPAEPRLAKRLEEGMEILVKDGSLRRIMLRFNGDLIRKADLCNRTVFQIENALLPPETPLARKELWFDPFDARRGVCPRTAKVPSR